MVMVVVDAHGGVRPFATGRVLTEDGQCEVDKRATVASKLWAGIATPSSLIVMLMGRAGLHAQPGAVRLT